MEGQQRDPLSSTLDAESVARTLRNARRLPPGLRERVHHLTVRWLVKRARTERSLDQRIAFVAELERLRTLVPEFEPDMLDRLIAAGRPTITVWRKARRILRSAQALVLLLVIAYLVGAVHQATTGDFKPLVFAPLVVTAFAGLVAFSRTRQLLDARDRRSRAARREHGPQLARYTTVMHEVAHHLSVPPRRYALASTHGRTRARAREHRPAARRRAGASSRTSSADPGDPDPASSPPALRLRRTRYGLVSPNLLDILVWTEEATS